MFHRFAHHRHDLAQMLARGQFRHHAAIFAVNLDLRRHHARKNAAAAGDNGRGGFVAGRFDAENQVFGYSHAGFLNLESDWKIAMLAWDERRLRAVCERCRLDDIDEELPQEMMAEKPKKVRKAVLPVAGLGTRFLPATKAIPKEMLTVWISR